MEQDSGRTAFFIFPLGSLLLLLAVLIFLSVRPDPADYSQRLTKTPADTVTPAIHSVTKQPQSVPGEFSDSLFLFKVILDSTIYPGGSVADSVKRIDIFRLADHKKIQSINPGENQWLEAFQKSYAKHFILEDMNFDGYSDFRILSWEGMRNQQTFSFWLYNPEKGLFEEDTNLATTWDVVFNHNTRTIFSNQRTGCCYDHLNQLFCWKNGRLELLREEEVMNVPSGDSTLDYVRTAIRENGKMTVQEYRFAEIPLKYLGYDTAGWNIPAPLK